MFAYALSIILTLPAADQPLYDNLVRQVSATCDSNRICLVRRGAPIESAIDLAVALAGEPGGQLWATRAREAVDWTTQLEDTLGGFYSRVDGLEMQSSIDKRTDWNARRLANRVEAWLMTGDQVYRDGAKRVITYMERVLVDGRGGFVSAPVGDQELVPDVNGHAIRAWLLWAAATHDVRRREFAQQSLDRIWGMSWRESVGLMRIGTFGEPLSWPLLSDQVEMGRALVLSAYLTGRTVDLGRAKMIGDQLLLGFEDRKHGGFRTRAQYRQDGKIKDAGRVGVENARAALFLCELSHMSGDDRYREAAQRTWRAFGKKLDNAGPDAADWALAIRASFKPDWPQRPDWRKTPKEEKAKRRGESPSLGRKSDEG